MIESGILREKLNNIPLMEIIIVTLYFFGQYKIGPLNVATAIIICTVIYRLLKDKKTIFYRPLLLLFLFMVFHDMIKMFFVSVNIINWVERIFFFLFLSTIIGNVDKEKLYKVWKFFGIIAMLGIFVQSVQVYVLGQSVGMINVFPFLGSGSINSLKEYMRPHSFFLEPAAFTTWILPLLVMALRKKSMVLAITVSISILLSTSAIGIIVTAILWIYYAFSDFSRVETRRNATIMLSFIAVGVIAFFTLSIFSAGMEKITNVSDSNTSDSTRLTLGFELYRDLEPYKKITGISYDNVEAFLRSGSVNLRDYKISSKLEYLGFVNSISNALLNYGLIGALLYISMFYHFYTQISKEYKGYVLICFVSIFAQSVFWNTLFIHQMAFMLISLNSEKDLLGIGLKNDYHLV